MTNYDTFARFYDLTMGERDDVITILHELITTYNPAARTILELGSGTGSILAGFEADYDISGIDMSLEMLQISQQKLPKAHLKQGTIAGFDLGQTYDVIYCVFDTINHLTAFSDWEKCFASAANHLGANGLFIFDMNTIGRMKALAAMPTYTQQPDTKTTVDMDIEPITDHEVEWHITVQEEQADGMIQVYHDQARETSFPLSQVLPALEEHFEILESFDSYHHAPSDQSDRIYFACRPKKPSSTTP